MAKENEDAKEVQESSPAPDAAAPQDDKQKAGESSPTGEQQTTQTEESLADVVDKAAKESLAREDAAERAAHPESTTEEKEPVIEEKAPGDEVDTTKDEDVPKEFHEHPAWKRIIGERNEACETAQRLESAAKAYESIVTYCKQRGITDDQFRNALEVVTLLNTDPAKAYEKLAPIVEQLELHTGKRLPEDLQAKVTEGTLDPETASEIARLRAEKQFAATRGQSEAQQRQQAQVASMVQGLNQWDASKRAADPDFDAKAELVRGVFLTLYEQKDSQGRSVNPVQSPQDAVALAERAYKEVNEKIAKFQPHKAEKRVLTSQTASTVKTKVAPKNTKEAVSAMLREKYGVELEEQE